MEQQQKDKNYFKAYHNIFKISNLNGKKFSISAKAVYCYLLSFSNAGLDIYPSYNAIAEEFGLTRNAAIKQINNLEEMGLIERVERPGESNIYRVLPINQEFSTGRSYSENIGTRHQQPVQVKQEVKDKLEPLETEFEDIIERKSSFAEELDKESSTQELLINQTSFNRSHNKMPSFTIPDDEYQCPF